MAEWLANLVRLAFLLRPTSAWTQKQKLWMDYQVPILLRSHKGFLDHAITIATEAEESATRTKFEPIEPLPASAKQPLAPAEAFSPTPATLPGCSLQPS